MIDIHSHILPGVDDGAKTEEDSIAMAKAAVDQGIHTITATPHHKNGVFENPKPSIQTSVSILQELFVQEEIPLTVLPGQEIRLYGDMIEDIDIGELLSLNHSKYMFVELPTQDVPRYTDQMMYNLQMHGYTPLIVHPERNEELLENPDKLYELVQRGVVTQLTAGSLIGKFGKAIQKFSMQLIESSLTHFIASDAHNTTSRGFCMQEAFHELKEQFGLDVYYTFMENSQLAVNNQNINKTEPERIKKKKFFGLF